MRESGPFGRIRIVETNPALRAAIERAVLASGFEASAVAEAGSPVDAGLRAGHALHLIDLDSPGAPGWLLDPEARARSLFLAADRAEAAALARRFGPALEVLIKPFSIQALEARLLDRARLRVDRARPLLDPILQTSDERFARVLERAWRLARLDAALCIAGELGTGRRALARAIVAASDRAGLPCVEVEGLGRSAGPGDGLEREIASEVARVGSGTLLLIEPGDWSPRTQAGLLAALHLRDETDRPRCITLTRTPFDPGLGEGRLLVELAYRLEGPTLVLPPIRERVADQRALCLAIARRVARELGRPTMEIDADLLAALAREGFAGNRLGIERALRSRLVQAGEGESNDRVGASGEPARAEAPVEAGCVDLRALERDAIVRALGRWNGNRTHASTALGISVRTLRNKIREYGLR